jgi:hypothetical protein
MKKEKAKVYFRVLILPIVFVWFLFVYAALVIFPLCIIQMMGLTFLILSPFIWILKKAGAKIEVPEGFINTGFIIIDYLATATICFWLPFMMSYYFIKEGELTFGL